MISTMIRNFYSMVKIIIYASLIILFVLFFANNLQTVQIKLFSVTKEIYVATWTLYSALFGFFVTALLFGTSWLRASSGSGQNKRKIESLQREVDYLRNRPILDEHDTKNNAFDHSLSGIPSQASLLDETESA